MTECQSLCFVKIFQKINLLKLGGGGAAFKSCFGIKKRAVLGTEEKGKDKNKEHSFPLSEQGKAGSAAF